MDALSAEERARALNLLLSAHPELAEEVEAIAIALIRTEDRRAVGEEVHRQLLGLHLRDLAERAGPQRGGGYVGPHEAADELLGGIVQPYWEDLRRRANIGAAAAACEITYGLLLGLYACRDEDDNDLALIHAGMPDAVDDLAERTLALAAKSKIDIDDNWLADECPEWLPLKLRAARARR